MGVVKGATMAKSHLISMEDTRLAYFVQQFPGTTHAAVVVIRDMLEGAEYMGRAATADELTDEIKAAAEELVRSRLTDLRWCGEALGELQERIDNAAYETARLKADVASALAKLHEEESK